MALESDQLERLEAEFGAACAKVGVRAELELVRRDWLGADGTVKRLFRELKSVPAETRPSIAARLNALRDRIERFVGEHEARYAKAARDEQLLRERFDPTLPSLTVGCGQVHPVTDVERRIAAILRPLGFANVLGPEIETEYFCFDALNIPAHHPARDMQDTFYTSDGLVLRTHATSVQSRVLAQGQSPVKVASFGRVYRNETEDASHQAMFHQFELVWVDKGLTLAQLMGLISHILKALYGKRRKIRFVPKFYPYTEPSIGPQIDCSICSGKGCAACGGAGWVTVAGAGMVHPKVLEGFGYDTKVINGFAFGLGTSRLASQLLGVPSLKALYDNDIRMYKPEWL